MYPEIDHLVRNIRHALKQPHPAMHELVTAILQVSRPGGPSVVAEQLAVLGRWAEDPTYAGREYARLQLDALVAEFGARLAI